MDEFSSLSAGDDFDDSPMELPPEDDEGGAASSPAEQESTEPAASSAEPEETPRQYATVVDFVEQFLVHAIGYKMSTTPGQGLRWDPEWHKYPMVVYRLIALHEAFEHAYAAGGSELSNWWVHHFDAHMKVLLDGDTGPFHAYDESGISSPPAPLPFSPAEDSPLLYGAPDGA